MSFASMSAEMMGWIPKGDPSLAENLLNEAWRKIQDEREWSFLATEATLYSPSIINVGSANVTQFSTTVVLDAVASAAVLPFVPPTVVAGSLLDINKRQFRVGSSSTVYSIANANASVPTAIVLTLDRLYTESSNAASTIQIYRCYYEPVTTLGVPTNLFKYWLGIQVPNFGYSIQGPNLYRTNTELQRTDPQRSAQGPPYWVSSYKADPNNNFAPLYEFWPHPTFSQGYPSLFVSRLPDFTNPTDTVPFQLTERLVICKALSLFCEWANMNKGYHPELQKTNWTEAKGNREAEYKAQLFELKKQDNSTFITNWLSQFKNWGWGPIDSNFFQSHDVPGWVG